MLGYRINLCLTVLTFSTVPPAWAEDSVTVYGDRPEHADDREKTAVIETIKLGDDPKLTQTVGGLIDQGLGVRVQRGGSTGRRETVQMRGAEGQQVSIYLGEVRLSPSGGGGVDLSTLPLHCLDSVDIIRGPVATSYGSGSQGGVIRLIPALGGRSPGTASLSTGSFGFGAVDVCAGFGKTGQRTLIGSRIEAGSGDFPYTDVNQRSRTRQNNDHQRMGAIIGHQATVGTAGTISTVVDTVYDLRGEPGSAEFPSTSARSEDLRTSFGLTWTDPSIGAGHWRTQTTIDGSHRRYHFRDLKTVFGGHETQFGLIDTQAGLRSSISYEGSRWHQPRLSLSGRYEQANTENDTRQTHRRRRLASVVDWTLYPAAQILVFGALRLDVMDQRSSVWVPRLGIVWSPTNQFSVRSNIGRTFRDPSFDELYFTGAGISGDPNLRPEDGLGGDLGIRWKRKGEVSFQADVTGYLNTFERLILFVPLDAYRIQATDRFAARTMGIEAAFIARMSSVWIKMGYHWQRARFDEDGTTPLPHRPDHRFVIRAGGQLGKLLLHTGVSTQTKVTSDRFGLRTLPAYSLADAGARLSVTNGLSVSVDVHNLLDQRGHFDSVHRPLPGRSYFLKAEWRPELHPKGRPSK